VIFSILPRQVIKVRVLWRAFAALIRKAKAGTAILVPGRGMCSKTQAAVLSLMARYGGFLHTNIRLQSFGSLWRKAPRRFSEHSKSGLRRVKPKRCQLIGQLLHNMTNPSGGLNTEIGVFFV